MSIFILHSNNMNINKDMINKINKNMEPYNISYPSPLIIKNNEYSIVLINKNKSIDISNEGILIGKINKATSQKWNNIRSPAPSGTYIIIRYKNEELEILSDFIGSNTVYYYYYKDKYIISNSIRAIVMLLGSFVLNNEVISWYISCGNMGPLLCWDKRIKVLPYNSKIYIKNNQLKIILGERFSFNKKTNEKQKIKLTIKNIIDNILENINFNKNERWIIPLSGGYDSRYLMLFYKNKFDYITWGLKDNENKKGTDANISNLLKCKYKLNHLYENVNPVEDFNNFLDNFVSISEGRVDHIFGYLDNFNIWKELYNKNYDGIIRGDENFGFSNMKSEKSAQGKNGFHRIKDNKLLKKYLPNNELPKQYKRKDNEELNDFADRFYHEFRYPMISSSLNFIKSKYIEVINPYLFNELLDYISTLPVEYRINKIIFKEIVDELENDIPIASYPSIGNQELLFNNDNIKSYFVENIKNVRFPYFNNNFQSKIVKNFLLNKYYKKILTIKKKVIEKLFNTRELDINIIVLRIILINKIILLYNSDSKIINNK